MLQNINIRQILFIDIETVPQYPSYNLLPPKMQKLWEHKAKFISRSNETVTEAYERAGIYAEFGKVICVSLGFVSTEDGEHLRIKSIADKDEKVVLNELANLLRNYFNGPHSFLGGHNIKEFDIPFLCRRMLINGIKLPAIIDLSGKKPWEVNHIDTMQLWKFGDYKNYTSLKLLAEIFGLKSPKEDIDGSDVARVYWQDDDLQRIAKYCCNDVITVVQLLQTMKGNKPYAKNKIVVVEE